MNYELIALVVFVLLMTAFLVARRKRVEIQKIVPYVFYFVLYKTKIGLKLMDKVSRKEKFMRVFAIVSIIVGFAGMVLICVLLVHNLYKIAFFPAAVSGVGIVLPIKAKGVFYVPFFYWIISILVVASVHEFSHGMIARLNKVRIKSSGFAFLALFLPIIPAAFVEPDEKELKKKKTKQQLEVFAAGPFSNIVLGFIFLGLFLLIAPPVVESALNFNGANITGISNSSVLLGTNISVGESIKRIDNTNITFVDDFTGIMQNKTPGQPIIIETDRANYSAVLGHSPKNNSTAYLGVSVAQNKDLKPEVAKKFGSFLPNTVIWILGLFWWLYLLNLGIGIFNLVPVGPIDGGRMVYVSLLKRYREERAKRIANWISIVFLMIIVLNVVAGFVL
jgi:membrane-associated protease RseP (regulator of RpoE activity)